MAYSDINGCKYYYEMVGQGEPLVMIRGLGSNADHWYPQLPVLSKHYQVLVFDNRGIARTSDVEGPYSIRGMAEDTIGLMDAAGFEKAHILSLSMGGMIAQEIALTYPQRVKGLILCVTHCGGGKQVPPTEEISNIFNAMIQEGTDEAKMAASAVLFAPETLEKRPELAAQYAEVSLRQPVPAEILTKQLNAAQDFDTWDRLPQITAPTLLLGADQDVLIPLENSEILAGRIPNAELVIVKGGGHQVLIEQADACNQAILNFLKKID
jgi:pimeloyl-ACP methyl ester carboxylesterase